MSSCDAGMDTTSKFLNEEREGMSTRAGEHMEWMESEMGTRVRAATGMRMGMGRRCSCRRKLAQKVSIYIMAQSTRLSMQASWISIIGYSRLVQDVHSSTLGDGKFRREARPPVHEGVKRLSVDDEESEAFAPSRARVLVPVDHEVRRAHAPAPPARRLDHDARHPRILLAAAVTDHAFQLRILMLRERRNARRRAREPEQERNVR